MTITQQKLTQQGPDDRAPVVERLENALGGDLTRFLLTALVTPQTATKH
jgi:hypothetical protein